MGDNPPVQRVQKSLVVVVPPVQIYILSIWQAEFHPSPMPILLSSHCSVLCLNPSPQFTTHVFLTLLGDKPPVQIEQLSTEVVVPPPQIYMGSIVQALFHPSPLNIPPSSHCSVACFSPSPQLTVQADLATLGEVPRVQKVQVSGLVHVPPVQACIASIVQVGLQPSPPKELPSSHCSLECFTPSPH